MRTRNGQAAVDFRAMDVDGQMHKLSDYRGRRVLLSFFRDPSCPFCNLRLFQIAQRHADWKKAGLVVLAFFKADPNDVIRYVARHPRPFVIVPDPNGNLYEAYGIERSWVGVVRAMMLRMPAMARGLRLYGSTPHMAMLSGQLPADFLLDETGHVIRAYYGQDISDHIPLAEIEAALQYVYPEPITPVARRLSRIRKGGPA